MDNTDPANVLDQSVSGETLGDMTIDTIVAMYEQARRQQPDEEPHIWLGNVWLGRAQEVHNVDISDPKMLKVALYETYLCSCVDPSSCARALGLYFLFKENADLIEKHPKYAQEFDELIAPVIEARENGTLGELYQSYNPKTAKQSGVHYHT